MDDLLAQLEERIRSITLLLYDTNVSMDVLDREVLPFIGPAVRFTDPWQEGHGREAYRLGAAGFHAMLSFDFHIKQVEVHLEGSSGRGRAIVDGIMDLKPLRYPLRTLLVYEFVVTDEGAGERPVQFIIQTHEEMWSLGDMLAAVPVVGWFYTRVFRRVFARGFLGASYLVCRAKGQLPRSTPAQ